MLQLPPRSDGLIKTSVYSSQCMLCSKFNKNLGLPLLIDKHVVMLKNKSSSELNLTVIFGNELPFNLYQPVLFVNTMLGNSAHYIVERINKNNIRMCSLQKAKAH